tara:strand:+ start:4295 stop:5584 length:1290 start_codon:yes stop_codon:yes gene_type:complete
MALNLLKVFKEAYTLMTNEDVRRLAAQPWHTVGAMLWATRLLRGDGSVPATFVCLGQALRPVADGAANQITLSAGMALFYDSSEGDLWTGKVKPIFLEADQTVTITTNNDASGHPRLDVVAVRPVEQEGDVRSATLKTPNSAPGVGTYTKDSPHQKSWEVEVQVFEGAAAASPVEPSLPSGWLKVCAISRPNGQADVNAGDVTDQRSGDVLRSNHLELTGASSLTRLLLGGQQYSGQTYSGLVRGNETESFWNEGDLIGIDNTFDDTKPAGTWWVDVLKVWTQLWVEELRTRAATRLDLKNAAGDAFVPLLGGNQVHAFGTFSYSPSNNRFELQNGWNFETNGTKIADGSHRIDLTNDTLSGNNATVISNMSFLGSLTRDHFIASATDDSGTTYIALQYRQDSDGALVDPPASPVKEFFVMVLDANATP